MKQLEYVSLQALKRENERKGYTVYSLKGGKMDFSDFEKTIDNMNRRSLFIDRKNNTIYELNFRKVKIDCVLKVSEKMLEIHFLNNKTYYFYN